jgi:hypothetical protein
MENKNSAYKTMLQLYPLVKVREVKGRYLTYSHIDKILENLGGKFQLKKIGESTLEVPVHKLTLGSGKIRILAWSQMHGNESTTTKAVIDVLNAFYTHEENPVLKQLKFEGNQAISTKKLKEILQLEVGKMLNTKDLNDKLRKIESYYQDEGYILGKVEDILMKKDGTLLVTINEGKLAGININGNEKTRDFVIERKLSMEAGDVFNVEVMKKNLRDIYNLGFFKDIKPKDKTQISANITSELPKDLEYFSEIKVNVSNNNKTKVFPAINSH